MSLQRYGILDRPAKGIDVVAKLLARVRIDEGERRRNDSASRLINRAREASGCTRESFRDANIWGQSLIRCEGSVNDRP